MDCSDIYRRLPHRYPFLLVDRVSAIVPGESCRGQKNVTLNEPCFRFVDGAGKRDSMRYPVALQLESFAQVGALLILASREVVNVDGDMVMLAGSVRGMKIKRSVWPGDTMHHHVEVIRELSDTVVIGGRIEVSRGDDHGNDPVAEIGSVVIAVRPKASLFPATDQVS